MNQQQITIQNITKMLPLVIDINVIISSLLNAGHSLMVFKLNNILEKYQFISPQFIMIEFNKHSSEIAKRSRSSIEEITKVIDFIIKQIKIIPDSQFSDKLDEARKMLNRHLKDAHYLALALAFNCNIFSGDKIFKKLCPEKVKTPREILDEFYNQ